MKLKILYLLTTNFIFSMNTNENVVDPDKILRECRSLIESIKSANDRLKENALLLWQLAKEKRLEQTEIDQLQKLLEREDQERELGVIKESFLTVWKKE